MIMDIGMMMSLKLCTKKSVKMNKCNLYLQKRRDILTKNYN